MRGLKLGIGGALALMVVLLAAVPSTAGAADVELVAKLPTKAGVSLRLDLSRGFGGFMALDRGHRSFRAAGLFAAGGITVASDGRVQAKIGRFGKVRARFVEDRRSRRGSSGICSIAGRRQVGHLVGRITFKGAEGLEPVDVRRVKAYIVRYHRTDCDSLRPHAPKKALSLSVCRRGGALTYGAVAFPGARSGSAYHFATYTRQPTGRTFVFSQASREDDLSTFTASSDLLTARASPGEPFDGIETYGGGEVTGDLSVDLLGIPHPVALAPSKNATLKLSRGVSESCGGAVAIAVADKAGSPGLRPLSSLAGMARMFGR